MRKKPAKGSVQFALDKKGFSRMVKRGDFINFPIEYAPSGESPSSERAVSVIGGEAVIALIAAITALITEVVKKQPETVAAELWKMHLEDVKAWRAFFRQPDP